MVIPGNNSGFRILTVHICLTHTGDQKYLVVHRQPEENTDHQNRQEGQNRPRVVHPKKRAHEAHLVDRNHRTEARQN